MYRIRDGPGYLARFRFRTRLIGNHRKQVRINFGGSLHQDDFPMVSELQRTSRVSAMWRSYPCVRSKSGEVVLVAGPPI